MDKAAIADHLRRLEKLMREPRPWTWETSGSVKFHEDCVRILRGSTLKSWAAHG